MQNWIQSVKQYEDELTQAIAMSMVPPEIHALNPGVEQIKGLLAWFKKDFFKWTDKPDC